MGYVLKELAEPDVYESAKFGNRTTNVTLSEGLAKGAGEAFPIRETGVWHRCNADLAPWTRNTTRPTHKSPRAVFGCDTFKPRVPVPPGRRASFAAGRVA